MKRIGNVLVAVAMMIGSIGAVGCNQTGEDPAQPEAAPVAQRPDLAPAKPAAPIAQPVAATAPATTAAPLPAFPALGSGIPGLDLLRRCGLKPGEYPRTDMDLERCFRRDHDQQRDADRRGIDRRPPRGGQTPPITPPVKRGHG